MNEMSHHNELMDLISRCIHIYGIDKDQIETPLCRCAVVGGDIGKKILKLDNIIWLLGLQIKNNWSFLDGRHVLTYLL